MPKLAANLSMMFTELPFLDRFDAAAQAGFKGVEFLFPYEFPAQDVADRLQRHGLEMVLFNLPPGDWNAGERGIACHPDREDEFCAGLAKALDYARVLKPGQLHCMSGILPAGVKREAGQSILRANLAHAAAALKAEGLRLLVEPINYFDIPGYFLNHTRQALDLIAELGADNVFLQYDIYHMQRMEGELASTIKANLGAIGHIQLADNPGRGEPGTGEINYRFLLPYLDQIGYAGWVGCEYKPRAGTGAGLGWLAAMG